MFDVKFCVVWPESAGIQMEESKDLVTQKERFFLKNCQIEWISQILDRNGEMICINNSMSESFSVVGCCL